MFDKKKLFSLYRDLGCIAIGFCICAVNLAIDGPNVNPGLALVGSFVGAVGIVLYSIGTGMFYVKINLKNSKTIEK
jgi:hypothetical protein